MKVNINRAIKAQEITTNEITSFIMSLADELTSATFSAINPQVEPQKLIIPDGIPRDDLQELIYLSVWRLVHFGYGGGIVLRMTEDDETDKVCGIGVSTGGWFIPTREQTTQAFMTCSNCGEQLTPEQDLIFMGIEDFE